MQNFSREILIHGHSPELSSLSPQVMRVWSLRSASLNWLLLTSAIFSSHGVWRRGVRHRSNIQLGGCTQNISDLWHPINVSWLMFWHGHSLIQLKIYSQTDQDDHEHLLLYYLPPSLWTDGYLTPTFDGVPKIRDFFHLINMILIRNNILALMS